MVNHLLRAVLTMRLVLFLRQYSVKVQWMF